MAGLKKKSVPVYIRDKLGLYSRASIWSMNLTCTKNVELPLTYLGIKATERRRMVEDMLKRMNISHRANISCSNFSGGQQQRASYCPCGATNPKLILADEPTGNLDFEKWCRSNRSADGLNKEGTTIIMVTHSQHDASFAHRTVHLFDEVVS